MKISVGISNRHVHLNKDDYQLLFGDIPLSKRNDLKQPGMFACNETVSIKGDKRMTKEDKQIIDRAVKEEWRIGDRTRLKRLLEKNLKLYRENVELEYENAELKEKYNRVDVIGYDALKNLTEAKDIIRALLFHLTDDTFYVTFETRGQSVEKARQFLIGGIKENE